MGKETGKVDEKYLEDYKKYVSLIQKIQNGENLTKEEMNDTIKKCEDLREKLIANGYLEKDEEGNGLPTVSYVKKENYKTYLNEMNNKIGAITTTVAYLIRDEKTADYIKELTDIAGNYIKQCDNSIKYEHSVTKLDMQFRMIGCTAETLCSMYNALVKANKDMKEKGVSPEVAIVELNATIIKEGYELIKDYHDCDELHDVCPALGTVDKNTLKKWECASKSAGALDSFFKAKDAYEKIINPDGTVNYEQLSLYLQNSLKVADYAYYIKQINVDSKLRDVFLEDFGGVDKVCKALDIGGDFLEGIKLLSQARDLEGVDALKATSLGTSKLFEAAGNVADLLGIPIVQTYLNIGGKALANGTDLIVNHLSMFDLIDLIDGDEPDPKAEELWLEVQRGNMSYDEAREEYIKYYNSFARMIKNIGLDIYAIEMNRRIQNGEITYDEALKLFEDSQKEKQIVYDPIVIDMNKDGFAPTTLEEGAHFDLDRNGYAEKINWVSGDDAILAYDRNQDGIINDGGEVFGDSTVLKDGQIAKNGFEALAELDSNADGVIDKNDEAFGDLRLWFDENGDGQSAAEELKTLEELNIESISLNYENINLDLGTGTIIGNIADVKLGNGDVLQAGEYWVSANKSDTIETDTIEIDEKYMQFADIKCVGNMQSLAKAMTLDATGELYELANQFLLAETDVEQKKIVEQILFKLAGADKVDEYSRGSEFSAKKLQVLEAALGEDFVGLDGANPNNGAAIKLEEAYNIILNNYSVNMLINTKMSYLKDYIIFDESGAIDKINTKAALGEIAIGIVLGQLDESHLDDAYQLLYVFGGDAYEECVSILRNTMPNKLSDIEVSLGIAVAGSENDDVVRVSGNANTLYGKEGNDSLYSQSGNDTLIGGEGNDYMEGGVGEDAYYFNLGDGKDTIFDANGTKDKIVFGEGISKSDIELTRDGQNLYLTNKESGDVITISRFFYDSWYKIETVEFADGSTIDLTNLNGQEIYYRGTTGDDVYSMGYAYGQNPIYKMYGGEGDDKLTSYTGNDYLEGGEGNDSLYSQSGNDTLIGGEGNDYMEGGAGDDAYYFNLGDGKDTIFDANGTKDKIVFGEGIDSKDIMFSRSGNHLNISVVGSDDSISLSNYYYSNSYKIEEFQTSDGSLIDSTKIDLMIQAIASFEQSTGMMWQDAVQNNNEQANDVISQWWVKN